MDGVGIIMTIILGGLAGWIAEKIMKFDTGLVMNIILGIAGALLGNFLLGAILQLSFAGSWLAQLVIAIGGACLLIFAYRMIKSRG